MIGLYGMPGVGKTTLAEVVGKQAREQKLFDKVVIVTVSQTPNINKIQDKIAEILGLKYETNTEEGKAEELWRRLKDQKKMLIIVDDVWKEFKLQTIGIPFGGEHKGCKILLTTRLQQVCIQMNCQEKFELKILSDGEAWALFKDNADLKDVSPTLNDVAKQVARECKGLPLAIVTMAKALKGESLDGWIAANERLKSSRHLDNQDICGGIYNCLELSYDYLKEDNIQSCFLLCSLFPEDYEINIELLTICGIGWGLFCHINLIEDLRREIRLALSKLKMSGLLLEIDDEGFVKMHDVVRDFAHWITLRGENIFIVKDGLTEWPMSESFGCYMGISLWNSKINNLPEKMEFSELKILFLTGKSSLRVSSMFFEGMKSLRVLFLGNVVFSLEALQFLTNLRTLCFVDCELQNISSLRNMKNLEQVDSDSFLK
ncbi:NB-ARC - like 10 [Theobroma cacao]|nr:NB-ARC - like 10 [Theobroma cacao]